MYVIVFWKKWNSALLLDFCLFFCHGLFCCHCCVVSVFFISYFWLRISEWKWSVDCYCFVIAAAVWWWFWLDERGRESVVRMMCCC